VSDFLEPLTNARKKRRYVVLDIETKDGIPGQVKTQAAGFTRPFLAGFFDGLSYLDWAGDRCLAQLLRFIIKPEFSGCYIYAHNGGGFDYLHLLQEIAKMPDAFDIELVPVASTVQAIRISRGKYRWTFLDSYKLIPASLEKAGLALKTDTQKQAAFDYATPEDDPRWREYLEQDCRALFSILSKFHDIIEGELGGEVGVTLASTSMLTYRRKYLKAPIERVQHCHDFVRAGYYGGNTQMFRRKVEGLRCYDINSSYPYAMLGPVPLAYHREYAGKPPAQFLENVIGFVSAQVVWPESVPFPCLPWRGDQKKLLYPAGTISGVWCHEELLLAEQMGAAVTWGKGHWFIAGRVLADYMLKLYSYRDPRSPAYDETISYVAKLLGNSLYGKFGQNPIREKIILLGEGCDFPLDARPASDDDDCRVFYKSEVSDADYIIPQIAATITARARIQLQGYINESVRRGGVVAYCDTDSVLTTADLSDLCGPELGQLKDEGKGCTFTGYFIQPKLYKLVNEQTCEVKVRMKGFRQATEETFTKAVSGETIVRLELEKLGALAAAGFRRGPLMREVKKSIQSTDTKRVWYPDGTSSPLVIDPEEQEPWTM